MTGKIPPQAPTVPIIHQGQQTTMEVDKLVEFLSRYPIPKSSTKKLLNPEREKDAAFTAQMVHDLAVGFPLTLRPNPLSSFERLYSRSPKEEGSQPIKIKVLSVIGMGGQATVYKCEQIFERTTRTVALKVPFQNETALRNLRREQITLKRAEKVANVPKSTSLHYLRGKPCLIMPLCTMDLFAFIEDNSEMPPGTLVRVADIVLNTTRDLLNKDIYQLDNSLENIFVNSNDPSSLEEVYLADFGGAVVAPPLRRPNWVKNFINLHTNEVNGTRSFQVTHRKDFSSKETLSKIANISKKLISNSNDLDTYNELRKELRKAVIYNLGATLFTIFSGMDLDGSKPLPSENKTKQILLLPNGHPYQKIVLDALYRLELPAQSNAELHPS